MDELPSAEIGYLFRHQMLREGLYQLLLPSERARLHLQAMNSYGPIEGNLQVVRELVLHAQLAMADGHDLSEQEVEAVNATLLRYLYTWAELAGRAWQSAEEAAAWSAVAVHPQTQRSDAAVAHMNAAKANALLGRNRECLVSLEACRVALEGLPPGAVDAEERILRSRTVLTMGDPHESESIAREGVRLAEELADPMRQARALENAGFAMGRMGQLDASLAARERACELAPRDQPAGRSDILVGYAGALREMGRHEQALVASREAYELAIESGDQRKSVGALISVAVGLRAQGDLDEAEALYRQGIELCKQRGIRGGFVACTGNLANLLSGNRGDYAQADVMLREVIQIHRENGSTNNEAIATNNLASNRLSSGRFTAAVQGFKDARELSARVSYALLEARAACFEGQCLALIGRYDEAAAAVQHGLACLDGRDHGKFRLEFGELSLMYVKLADPQCADPLEAASAAAARMRALAEAVGADLYSIKSLEIATHTEAHLRESETALLARGRVPNLLSPEQCAAMAAMLKDEAAPALLEALTTNAANTPTPDWRGNCVY